jgi:hypothetical protein
MREGAPSGDLAGALGAGANVGAPPLQPGARIHPDAAIVTADQPEQLALGERAATADAAAKRIYDSSSSESGSAPDSASCWAGSGSATSDTAGCPSTSSSTEG